MPERFSYSDADQIVLLPLRVDPDGPFDAFGLSAPARLAPDVTLDDARREADGKLHGPDALARIVAASGRESTIVLDLYAVIELV